MASGVTFSPAAAQQVVDVTRIVRDIPLQLKSHSRYKRGSADVKVKVTEDDPLSGYLQTKVEAGNNIALSITEDVGTHNQRIRIDSTVVIPDPPTPVVVPDTDNKTIELNHNAGDALEGTYQMFGADTVQSGTVAFPVMRGPNIGGFNVLWAEIDGEARALNGQSLAIRNEDGVLKLEIKGFNTPEVAGTLDDSDKVLLRRANEGQVKPLFATKAELQAWLGIDDGDMPTIDVGDTITGEPGTDASVVNVGTATDLILQFTIPRGADGANGMNGTNGTNGTNGADGVVNVAILWDGVAVQPALQAGNFWYLSNVTLVAQVMTFFMVQTCLPMANVPGRTPVNDTVTLTDASGVGINLDITEGLIDAAYAGSTFYGTDPATGQTINITVTSDGHVTGHTGLINMVSPTTGESKMYRVSSEGLITE